MFHYVSRRKMVPPRPVLPEIGLFYNKFNFVLPDKSRSWQSFHRP